MTSLLRLAFWGALALAVTMALLPHPPDVIEVGDKFRHMLAFGTLAMLAVAAWPNAELLRIGERLSFLGALIEVLQSIPRLHRDCDIMDWIADTSVVAGVLVVVLLWRLASRTIPPPPGGGGAA